MCGLGLSTYAYQRFFPEDQTFQSPEDQPSSMLFVASRTRDRSNGGMVRRLRVQYPDAIYHLMARGNGRQDIVRDDADRDRLVEVLGSSASEPW
jgi:hypothetical protein